MPISIREARAETDLDRIQALLARCQLPPVPATGLELKPENYFVITAGGAIVACAGLEVYGQEGQGRQIGLLRSLAVDPQERKRGFGSNLLVRLVERARQLGLTELYGLTTAAQEYLVAQGFRPVPRADAPACLQESDQFKELCPATATLLKITL